MKYYQGVEECRASWILTSQVRLDFLIVNVGCQERLGFLAVGIMCQARWGFLMRGQVRLGFCEVQIKIGLL